MSYGIGYKGSKSRIADLILSYLPDGKRFCDLFGGGGGAMSHAAALSGKYESVRNIDFRCGSYADYEYMPGDIVYCDIPYQTSTTHKTYCNGFDWTAFYDWARTRPYQVYFSSYEIAERDFYSAKLCDKTSGFSATNNSLVRAEYLYSNMPFDVVEQCTIF